MNKRNKIIIFSLVVIIILVIVTSIILIDLDTKSKEKLEVNVPVSTMISDILTEFDETNITDFDSLVDLTPEYVTDIYKLDLNIIDSYVGKIPLINIKAHEFVIVKVKDSNNIKTVEETFKNRAIDIANNFKDYLEDQYALANDPLIVTNGMYVLFSISENNDVIEKQFNSYFTEVK